MCRKDTRDLSWWYMLVPQDCTVQSDQVIEKLVHHALECKWCRTHHIATCQSIYTIIISADWEGKSDTDSLTTQGAPLSPPIG